jgi:hypothetical protein
MCGTCCPSPRMSTPSKEIKLAARLVKWAANHKLPIYTKWGRQNPEADPIQCDGLKPDFLWDLEDEQRVVILENDENGHRTYPVRCEFSRPFKLGVGYKRPLHLIRYNCDELPFVDSDKLPARNEREALLLSRLQAALEPATDDSSFEHAVTVEFLYYYDIPGSTATAPFLQTVAFATLDDCEAWAIKTIDELEGQKYRLVQRVLADAESR